jgi:hypothetical protein
MNVLRLCVIAPLLLITVFALGCTRNRSNDGHLDGWMGVTVTGEVTANLWRTDGDPLSYYETNEPRPGSNSQYFGIYASEPVIVRLDINHAGPVTVDVISWRYESGWSIMDSKLEEVDQHATFEIEESAGGRVELMVAREEDFNELTMDIDRDADGTIDAEVPPTSVTDDE